MNKPITAISALLLTTFSLTSLAGNALPNTFQGNSDAQSEVNFLTGSLLFEGNGYFQTVDGKLPRSYFSNNIDYFGKYVCASQDCSVKDVISYGPYAIAPDDKSIASGQLQEERVFTTKAADIYDAATWQIAVALAAAKGLSVTSASTLIDNQNQRLNKIPSRATAGGDTGFTYGYGDTATTIQNLKYAYAFRMLGPKFLADDPFKNTSYSSYVKDGEGIPDDQKGQVTWADWKPITGENAWGFLLGPLQSAQLLAGNQPLSTDSLALNNALNFLWALQRMQSPIGAFYYAMNGSEGNTGKPVPEGEISTENNASILGGLAVLQKTIQAIPNWQSNEKLSAANNVIDIMLYGGDLPQGGTTEGLLSYFKNDAWNKTDSIFYQGGTYKTGKFTPTTNPFALDVNTWGTSAIGPKTLDSWFGAGSAYHIWEAARKKSGYFDAQGNLMGVGYTDQSGSSDQKVLSGEWTAGAINTVHMLIQYYSETAGITSDQLKALQTDESSMEQGLLKLRTDNYKASDFQNEGGVDSQYLATLPTTEKAVLYASRRYNIPFGWYANPLPSTASTSWTLMLNYWFNPFGYKGSMNSPDFTGSAPSYDKSKTTLYSPNTVTVLNELRDATTQELQLPVSVSYNTTNDPNNWIPLVTINNGSWGDISIPDSADTIGVAYQVGGQWYPACHIKLTDAIRDQLKGSPIHTAIVGAWVSDPNNPSQGNGPCKILTNTEK